MQQDVYAKIHFMASEVSGGFFLRFNLWCGHWNRRKKNTIPTVIMHFFIPRCCNRKYKTVIAVEWSIFFFCLILAYLNAFFYIPLIAY